MELTTILLIAVYVIAIIIGWKVFKTVFKVLSLLFLITSLLFVGFAVLVFLDFKDFRENSDAGRSFAFVDDQKVWTVIRTSGGEDLVPEVVTADQRTVIEQAYLQGDYEPMLGSSHKVFIVTSNAIEEIDDLSLDLEDNVFTDAQIREALTSDNPETVLGGDAQGLTPEETRAYLFTAVVAQKLMRDPTVTLNKLKEGSIEIYPPLHISKGLNLIPTQFIGSVADKLVASGIEEE